MDRLLTYILQRMLDFGLINEDEKDVLHYGLELFLIKISHYCGIFLVAIIVGGGKGVQIILFFMPQYLYLRSITGGYHSKTRLGCFMISILITALVITNYKAFEISCINWIRFIASIFICINCPIENINAPLTQKEKNILKQKVKIMLLLFNLINIVLMNNNDFEIYGVLINIIILLDAFFILIHKFENWKGY